MWFLLSSFTQYLGNAQNGLKWRSHQHSLTSQPRHPSQSLLYYHHRQALTTYQQHSQVCHWWMMESSLWEMASGECLVCEGFLGDHDEVTEDSAEQIVVEQYTCEECEFYVNYLTTWKGTKWLKMEEFRLRMIQCSWWKWWWEPRKVRRGWNYNKWHLYAKYKVDKPIEKPNDAAVR